MSLNTQIIGKTMPHGFAGTYARQPDMIVNTRPVGGAEAIPFGTALKYDSGKVVVMGGAGTTAAQFAGIAGSEVKSAMVYPDQNGGKYAPGDACSVFQRGSINVLCQRGMPTLGSDVYVRIAATAGYPAAVVGGFEAAADDKTAGNSVKLTNCQWGGAADVNGVAELVILTRANA